MFLNGVATLLNGLVKVLFWGGGACWVIGQLVDSSFLLVIGITMMISFFPVLFLSAGIDHYRQVHGLGGGSDRRGGGGGGGGGDPRVYDHGDGGDSGGNGGD